MDPAIELATLITSYVWALHDLFPQARTVGDLQPHLATLHTRLRDDYGCAGQLIQIASRTASEQWPPTEKSSGLREPDFGSSLHDAIDRRRASTQPGTPTSRYERIKRDLKHRYDDLVWEAARPEDFDSVLEQHLYPFVTHATYIVSLNTYGNELLVAEDGVPGAEPQRRAITQDRFTMRIASRLLQPGRMVEAVGCLQYCPLLLRELWVRSRTKPTPEALLDLLDDPSYPRKLIAQCGSENVALPFSLVHHRELDEIELRRRSRGNPEPDATSASMAVPWLPGTPQPPRLATDRALSSDLVGLAISGGGIRSATFALGVLQGLASRGWLTQLDYLSTVSGGGYIGAWFLTWIKRRGSVLSVQNSLRGFHPETGQARDNPDPGAEHVRPIRLLREYSNYLSPKGGAFSTDTWTIGSIWLRNTLLNLFTLTLFLMFALLLPRILGIVFVNTGLGFSLMACFVGFWIAAALAGLNLQTFEDVSLIGEDSLWRFLYPKAAATERGDSSHLVLTTIVVPMAIGGFCAVRALWLWWEANASPGATVTLGRGFWSLTTTASDAVLLLTFVLLSGGLLLTALLSQRFIRPRGVTEMWQGTASTFKRGLQQSVLATVCGLVAAYAGARIVKELWEHLLPSAFGDTHRGTWLIVAFGPIAIVLIVSFVIVLYLGLLGLAAPDERREWWSRLGAWLGICALGWGAMTVITYFSPYILASGGLYLSSVTIGWTTVTAVGAWLASSGKSNGMNLAFDRNVVTSWVITLAPYLFVAGFLVAVAVLTQGIEYWLRVHAATQGSMPPFSLLRFSETYWSNMKPEDLKPAVLAAILLGAAALLAWRVDVNEFSMHHFYKNRLVRAYLGASRWRSHRRPNAFTGLDMDDDVKLWRFVANDRALAGDITSDCRAGFNGPFAIFNTTLNLTTGDELAYRERKGQSFMFTPLYCGFDFATKQTTFSESVRFQYALRPTKLFGYSPGRLAAGMEKSPDDTGLGIGTAIAISGAAANPNAGYHSSPAVAFLLTLFNARLGWWIGNPCRDTWKSASPGIGLTYLLSELFGFSNQKRDYVNLSDGGHFDNMGLYELVRRRCKYIVVCDGEQDDQYSFNGLAGAIRKCRVDFGVVIDIDVADIRPSRKTQRSKRQAAVGTIRYPPQDLGTGDGTEGTLIYVKASLTGREPTDVEEYHAGHKEFPHQTTADQFFNESQFESYRALGQHIADWAFPTWPGAPNAPVPPSVVFKAADVQMKAPDARRSA